MSSSAGKGDSMRKGANLPAYWSNYDNIFRRKEILDDGFGNSWRKCNKKNCALEIVRPGKVQCEICEYEIKEGEISNE